MKNRLNLAFLVMGFTSLIVQSLLIREFLISFYGNELTIGIILANWIILEAFGSAVFSGLSDKVKRPVFWYVLLQILISLYLPLGIFLIRSIKIFANLSPGEGVGLITIFVSSFFILAPLSIFDGAQFPLGCRKLSEITKGHPKSVGYVYILEAVGFIIAGPLFTFVFILRLNSFHIAFIVGILNFVSGLLLILPQRKTFLKTVFKISLLALILTASYLLFSHNAERLQAYSIKRQWTNQNVLDYRNSIYGNLAVTKAKGQLTFFSDGIPIITTPVPNIIENEEFVHFGMLAHQNPKNILLISGGAGGMLGEIQKYPVNKIEYAELDPLLIKMVREFSQEPTLKELNNPKLTIHYIDGRRFVQTTRNKYDVIFLNLPAPYTLQLNRFYTQNFFSATEKILKPKGILALDIPGSLSYLSKETVSLNASILKSLKSAFNFVHIIPGENNLYLASNHDFKINPDIFVQRLKGYGIATELLTASYIKYRLDEQWVKWFNNSLGSLEETKPNSDLMPSATFYGIAYWNSLFSGRLTSLFEVLNKLSFKILALAIFLLGLFLIFICKKFPKVKKIGVPFAIGSTGLVGMAINLIVIFAYQSFYGFVFHHIALLITAFMGGLALGGFIMTKNLKSLKNDRLSLIKIETGLIIFCLIAIVLLLGLALLNSPVFMPLFFIVSIIAGCLVGLEFPLGNKVFRDSGRISRTGGLLYAADLLGSWFAAIFVSICFMPLIGIVNTCLLLIMVKALSLCILLLN